jgi:hypothetical protein
MQGYTPNTVKTTDITNVDPTGLGVTNEAVGSTGDLGGATDVGYKGSTGGFLGFGKTEGVGDSGPTGLGDTRANWRSNINNRIQVKVRTYLIRLLTMLELLVVMMAHTYAQHYMKWVI